MSKRSRGYFRFEREKHIKRKERIISSYRADGIPHAIERDDVNYGCRVLPRSYGDCMPYWSVKSRGVLADGKIHCSCQLCAFHETPQQDKRRMLSMIQDVEDLDYVPCSKVFINKTLKNINKYRVR